MKIAALFAGQGSQYPGMGEKLRRESAAARRIYQCAEDILGFDIAVESERATPEQLAATALAQPAIFAHSLAAYHAARELLPAPEAAAGHSLGEYAALCCAGCFSVEDGFRIISARASVMEEAARIAPGTMAAISGPDAQTVTQICARYDNVWAVNLNLPSQTVISGEEKPCLAAAQELAEAGGRVTRLAVGSAFHTPMMNGAAQKLRELIGGISYSPPRLDFYSNLTGGKLIPQDFPDYFAEHMINPVLFTVQLAAMVRDGIDTCVEFGPGRTVSGLARKNCRELHIYNVEDCDTLQKTLGALQPPEARVS